MPYVNIGIAGAPSRAPRQKTAGAGSGVPAFDTDAAFAAPPRECGGAIDGKPWAQG